MNKPPKTGNIPLRIAAMCVMLLIFLFFSVVGASLLNLFGGAYGSKTGLILFFGMSMLVAMPLDPLTRRIEKRYLIDRKTRWQFIYLVVDTALTALSILVVDHFDGTVAISPQAACGTGAFFALLNLFLLKKENL